MISLEALDARKEIATFPPNLDLGKVATIDIPRPGILMFWEDVLDLVRERNRPDLERVVEDAVAKGKRRLGFPSTYRRRRLPGPPPTIRIGVIVPTWRQPQYLAAAVESVLDQEIDIGVGVVIVNDGCPFPSTDRIGHTLGDANSDRVAYLRQQNRGLSGARNAGIQLAIARWPYLEALFPLDVDNLLSRQTLAELWARLHENPDAAWVSPALEFFGTEDGEWQLPGPYLSYRQLFTNQSDAGSLIRRSVFDAGIEFDKQMTAGFEDWEFFLHAGLSGFQGMKAGRCGFRYRRRPHSMLTSSEMQAAEIEAQIRSIHASAYESGALTRREHAEAPRFALLRCDRDDVLLTASCDLEPHHLSLSRFVRTISQGGREQYSVEDHIPAITVFTTASTLQWLDGQQLLPGVLLRLQIELSSHAVVGLRIAPSELSAARDAIIAEPTWDETLSATAMRTSGLPWLLNAGRYLTTDTVVNVHSGSTGPPEPIPESLIGSTAVRLKRGSSLEEPFVGEGSQPQFFETHHLDALDTTIPWSGGENAKVIVALAARSKANCAQSNLVELVLAMRSLDHLLSAHLILMTTSVFEAGVASEGPFDSVTALGGVDQEAASKLLGRLLAGADAVLHSGTTDGLAVLPLAGRQRSAQIVLAENPDQAPEAEYQALLAAREYEPLIDAYVTCSNLGGQRLKNLAAIPDKVIVAQSSPTLASKDSWVIAASRIMDAIESASLQPHQPAPSATLPGGVFQPDSEKI